MDFISRTVFVNPVAYYRAYLVIGLYKTNILNESERLIFTMNEYSNIIYVCSVKLLA